MKTPKKPRQSEVVYIRMTPKQRAELRAAAAKSGGSEAALVRRALAYFLPVPEKAS